MFFVFIVGFFKKCCGNVVKVFHCKSKCHEVIDCNCDIGCNDENVHEIKTIATFDVKTSTTDLQQA
jgi:hypothetical protein